MSNFNQNSGTAVPTLINSSSVLVTGNAASAHALTVRQFGGGNVFSAQTTTGSTALFVGANGNVGVGTTTPQYPLDVNGQIRSIYPILADSTATGSNYSIMRITTGGDGNNYIQSAAAQTGGSTANLIFSGWFGGGESMRITSAGRVGIGTASPVYTLDMVGDFRGSSGGNVGGAGNSLYFNANNGNTPMAQIKGLLTNATSLGNGEDQGGLGFYTRPSGSAGQSLTQRMFISYGGSVGIGTASPGYQLDVSSFGVDGGTIRIASSSSCQFRMMEVNDTYGFSFTNVAASRMSIKRHSGLQAGTEIISIMRDNQYVGIGTTNPSFLLDVNGSMRVAAASTYVGGSGGISTTWAFNYIEPVTFKSMLWGYGNSPGNAAEMAYNYVGSASASNWVDIGFYGFRPFSITYAGNVGIGTTAPAAKLGVVVGGSATVAGPNWDANWFTVGTAGNNIANAIGLGYNTGSNYGVLACVQPTIGWRNMTYTAAAHDFYLNGTYATSIRNVLTGGATTISVDASGYIQRGAVSDQRLKSNIVSMTDFGLATVTALRPVTYEATPESLPRIGAGVHIGLVAQEVQTIFPYAVSADQDEQKTLTIDYIKIVPVMINAIKELSAENTALKTQLAAMEQSLATATANVSSLDARLAAIEAKLNSQ